MAEMTYQQVRDNFIQNLAENAYLTMTVEEINLVIEALEKQIPQKPVKARTEIVCPNCRTLVGSSPYCRYCGQAIQWEGNE
ncbi:MAG: hypothetical protein Q4A45_01695 [Clostridia bacterium]|nr:hypothetical protein [Clostridia bacterium]